MYVVLITFCPDVLVEYQTATNRSAEPKSMLVFLVEFCLSADIDVVFFFVFFFCVVAGPVIKLTMFDKRNPGYCQAT